MLEVLAGIVESKDWVPQFCQLRVSYVGQMMYGDASLMMCI